MHMQTTRLELLQGYISDQANVGTESKLADYQNLIAATLGGLPLFELDKIVDMTLQVRYAI